MLKNPEIIKDCVRQFRNSIPSNKTISIKLRLLDDHRQVLYIILYLIVYNNDAYVFNNIIIAISVKFIGSNVVK